MTLCSVCCVSIAINALCSRSVSVKQPMLRRTDFMVPGPPCVHLRTETLQSLIYLFYKSFVESTEKSIAESLNLPKSLLRQYNSICSRTSLPDLAGGAQTSTIPPSVYLSVTPLAPANTSTASKQATSHIPHSSNRATP